MANSNTAVITKIRDLVERGGKIDPDTRDILLFSAVVDIYDQLGNLRTDTQPAVIFSRVGLWFASAIGLGVITFIGGLLTGRIQLIFR